MYYVNARWLGGMMTNFRTIRKRIDRHGSAGEDAGGRHLRACCPRRKCIKLELEMEKLDKYLGGVKNMKTLPEALCSSLILARSASPLLRPAS